MTAGGEGPSVRSQVGRPGPSWAGSGRAHEQPQAQSVAPPGADAERAQEAAGLPIASFWRRALGMAIDTAVLAFVLFVLGVTLGLSPTLAASEGEATLLYLVNLFLQLGYYWFWNSIGWSPGKRAVGLRIVMEEGGPPGVERGFARTVGSLVSGLAFLLGYLWALWDPRTQTWHDKMAGTYVVVASPREDDRTGAGPRRPVG